MAQRVDLGKRPTLTGERVPRGEQVVVNRASVCRAPSTARRAGVDRLSPPPRSAARQRSSPGSTRSGIGGRHAIPAEPDEGPHAREPTPVPGTGSAIAGSGQVKMELWLLDGRGAGPAEPASTSDPCYEPAPGLVA